jgi:hypothetical protein
MTVERTRPAAVTLPALTPAVARADIAALGLIRAAARWRMSVQAFARLARQPEALPENGARFR